MFAVPHAVIALAESLELHWQQYRDNGGFEAFVEFTLSLNGLTERLSQLQLSGLLRAGEALESAALALFGDPSTHPISPAAAAGIEAQLAAILSELRRYETPAVACRRQSDAAEIPDGQEWNRPRQVLIVSRPNHPWTAALGEQLGFYGFQPRHMGWADEAGEAEAPLAVIFVPDREDSPYPETAIATLRRLRSRFAISHFYCLSAPATLEAVVVLQRAGADVCVPAGDKISDLLSRILDLVETREQGVPRVLVVEDSPTAVAHIQRSLSQHGIDSRAINDPRSLLEAAAGYRPDIILMDMYMPFCTGVEVTRALRQLREFHAVPVVYLSSETDIAHQVEALRLGGDQFLTKPVNPVVLAAVVKTKIERYRDMLYSGRHDSLTGLLNHTAAKARLDELLTALGPGGQLAVAMIDIDRFKSINDNYGHPVGDQVILRLAWLLRGRLRSTDLIGRYGGEEFIVALPGVGIDQATRILDRIRESFSSLPHAHAEGTVRVTFSGGIAALPDHAGSGALAQAADSALLKAKRGGRNRIVVAARPAA